MSNSFDCFTVAAHCAQERLAPKVSDTDKHCMSMDNILLKFDSELSSLICWHHWLKSSKLIQAFIGSIASMRNPFVYLFRIE